MNPLMEGLGFAARSGAGGLRKIAAAVSLLAVCPSSIAQEAPQAPEYRIKAAFLYNFTLYTEWPPNAFERADSPILLAVAGEDPFGLQLDSAVRGKTVQGRSIEVRRYERAADVPPCHLVFLSDSQARNLPQLLRRLEASPLLTVGETEDFIRAGGVIRFFVEENKVRFEVNVDAALRAHVKFSSKLLSLARIARDAGAPKDR
jgi:hypothetical protein